jgi:hypothetical protein
MTTKQKIYIALGIVAAIAVIAGVWYWLKNAKWRTLKETIAAKKKAGAFKPYTELSGQAAFDDLGGNIKANIAPVDGDAYEALQSVVLGFFKSYDIEPTGWNVKLLANEIKQYIAAGGEANIYVTQGSRL